MPLWFSHPKPPIDDVTRQWADKTIAELTRYLGLSVVQAVPVLEPTPEFFAEVYAGEKMQPSRLVSLFSRHLQIDPEQIQLVLLDEPPVPGVGDIAVPYTTRTSTRRAERGDLSETFVLTVPGSLQQDEVALVGYIAHELCVKKLAALDENCEQRTDKEAAADLLTVFMGMGILTANVRFRYTQWGKTNRNDGCAGHGWSIRTQGYIAEEVFGYALAVFAQLRQEKHPGWRRHLNTNVRAYFDQSTRFVNAEWKGRKSDNVP